MAAKKFCSLVVAGALSAFIFACSNGTDSSDENRDSRGLSVGGGLR